MSGLSQKPDIHPTFDPTRPDIRQSPARRRRLHRELCRVCGAASRFQPGALFRKHDGLIMFERSNGHQDHG